MKNKKASIEVGFIIIVITVIIIVSIASIVYNNHLIKNELKESCSVKGYNELTDYIEVSSVHKYDENYYFNPLPFDVIAQYNYNIECDDEVIRGFTVLYYYESTKECTSKDKWGNCDNTESTQGYYKLS